MTNRTTNLSVQVVIRVIHKNTARTISIFAEMQHHNQNKLNENAQVLHILFFFCMSNSKPQIQHTSFGSAQSNSTLLFLSFVFLILHSDEATGSSNWESYATNWKPFLSLCFNLWFCCAKGLTYRFLIMFVCGRIIHSRTLITAHLWILRSLNSKVVSVCQPTSFSTWHATYSSAKIRECLD